MRSHQSIRQKVQLSELKAMECEQMGRAVGAFVVLINVKGIATATRTRLMAEAVTKYVRQIGPE